MSFIAKKEKNSGPWANLVLRLTFSYVPLLFNLECSSVCDLDIFEESKLILIEDDTYFNAVAKLKFLKVKQ